ncbi:3-hydroxyacyl-CoA dehydrogenase NAD-binding domain-containing protein [Corynebacterium pseudokroppenstedtii]|uniref:3-hydroxyacyl-CoA dehydrogenase NAD-binding domain-containing protein n=1 Tax=Corynebacterium pseudokroppenstedtii TaxID=2804917 RepID=UPI003079E377
MSINRILIAGGGTLGTQSALQFALKGKNVTIYTHGAEAINRTKTRLDRFAEVYKSATNYEPEAIDKAVENIRFTDKIETGIPSADLIFECLPEDKSLKHEFFTDIAKQIKTTTIVATNSSTFLPSYFTDCFSDPSIFVAVHFANEIWVRNVAEIMPHPDTSSDVVAEMETFTKEVGLNPVKLNREHPGYLLNSVLIPFIRSGLTLATNKVAEPQSIDTVWETVMGSEGPFHTIDIIGLRTVYAVLSAEAKHGVPDSKELADFIFKNYLEKGRLGIENGKGFYDYQ